jgi:hypothetical protein
MKLVCLSSPRHCFGRYFVAVWPVDICAQEAVLKNSMLVISLIAAASAHAASGPEFDAKRLSHDVKVLSSDEFEGRGPNTAGETKTVDYLIEQFKAAGLKPGGDLSGASAAGPRTCRSAVSRSRARSS